MVPVDNVVDIYIYILYIQQTIMLGVSLSHASKHDIVYTCFWV